jgi:hypothetical protein
MIRTRTAVLSLLSFLLLLQPLARAQNSQASEAAPRLIGEVFANGRQLAYVSALSDEIGSRLTGTAGARRAEEWAEGEMKRLGLSNVPRAVGPLSQFGDFSIEHSAFAATDNAPFMAEGVPNLILLQDETPYFPVHHTIADTPDKIDPRDYASAVATLAATAYAVADARQRFGRRLNAEEVKRMADETKVGEQWRAAGIWK